MIFVINVIRSRYLEARRDQQITTEWNPTLGCYLGPIPEESWQQFVI